jgi:hypothetical protein
LVLQGLLQLLLLLCQFLQGLLLTVISAPASVSIAVGLS